MNKEKMIERLESIVAHCESMIDKDDPDCIWKGDTEALMAAVEKFTTECEGNDAQGIIRAILAKEGMNQQQLADKVGTIRQNISQMLTRGEGMRFSSFQKMVEALDYEVFCRKKS